MFRRPPFDNIPPPKRNAGLQIGVSHDRSSSLGGNRRSWRHPRRQSVPIPMNIFSWKKDLGEWSEAFPNRDVLPGDEFSYIVFVTHIHLKCITNVWPILHITGIVSLQPIRNYNYSI